ASTAQLLGVEPNKVNPFSMLLSAVFIGIVGAGFYLFGIEPTLNPEYENMGFSCQGKTYCSEMVSCNEAKFYLSNCPNVKIDGDNDGIPCESQFCGNW
ncbi:TPA: excalibur calcium-binding domain-containing protein, partial [Vibrio parahaemolyticus]|nr:excalibur calcium-binding domain-containing protein [Vibrio parahaemolyticus]